MNNNDQQPESWAIVELMGHVAMAGRVTKPGEYGGLWQIDIPMGDTFRTEFFGSQSVYRIRMVSEEIARVYAPRHEVIEYNAPIITREEHERTIERYVERVRELQEKYLLLRNQLGDGKIPLRGDPTDDSDVTPDKELEYMEDELDLVYDDDPDNDDEEVEM